MEKCYICNGDMNESMVDELEWKDIVFLKVPCNKCDECGEYTVPSSVLSILDNYSTCRVYLRNMKIPFIDALKFCDINAYIAHFFRNAKRIFSFYHSDFDGKMCQLNLRKFLYNSSNTHIEHVEKEIYDFDTMNKDIFDKIDICDDNDIVVIQDLSLNDDLVEKINSSIAKFIIIDHHEKSVKLNDKLKRTDRIIKIIVKESEDYYDFNPLKKDEVYLVSASLLSFDTFFSHNYNGVMKYYSNIASLYDTWLWQKNEDISSCKLLQEEISNAEMTFKELHIDILSDLLDNNVNFHGKIDSKIINLISRNVKLKNQEYLKSFEDKEIEIISHSVTISEKIYRVGVIFNLPYKLISRKSEEFRQQFDYDFYIFINTSDYVINLRSGVDDKISMFDIADIFSGGGHKGAAGFQLNKVFAEDDDKQKNMKKDAILDYITKNIK